MSSLLLKPSLRPLAPPSLLHSPSHTVQQSRHARLLRRPKRPYTFTQLVTLSDGSAFTMRTTSPLPVYRSTRDTRNAPLWNPRSRDLQNMEEDEAGRLRGFRDRFGTGFDAVRREDGDGNTAGALDGEAGGSGSSSSSSSTDSQNEMDEWEEGFSEEDANLMDLISAYNVEDRNKGQPWQLQKEKRDKKKRGT